METPTNPRRVFPFDPDSGTIPDDLPSPAESGGEVLALVADAATRENGWAARAAVALARSWAAGGRQVLLLDGDVGEPRLHRELGHENGEGVTDAVLYGVSTSRIASSGGEGLLFAPAGTVVAEPSSVLRHPRWSSVLSEWRNSARVTLLYLPGGVGGAGALAGQADRVIRFATALAAAEVRDPDVPVLHPAKREEGDDRDDSATADDDREGGVRGEPSRQTVSSPTTSPAGKGATAPPRGRLWLWLVILLVLLAAGVAGALWLGYLQLPGNGAAATLPGGPYAGP